MEFVRLRWLKAYAVALPAILQRLVVRRAHFDWLVVAIDFFLHERNALFVALVAPLQSWKVPFGKREQPHLRDLQGQSDWDKISRNAMTQRDYLILSLNS